MAKTSILVHESKSNISSEADELKSRLKDISNQFNKIKRDQFQEDTLRELSTNNPVSEVGRPIRREFAPEEVI